MSMKKILFLCDLDNTLLYSYKHRREGDICIEILKDKEQGFTSPKTLELLWQVNMLDNVCTVPLTTRSIDQYTRIKWGDAAPKKALVTNGTLLLNGEEIDEDWWIGSLETVTPLKSEIQRMFELLSPQEIKKAANKHKAARKILFIKSPLFLLYCVK